MASTSETGHAKNVDNFSSLIDGIASFGATYNPSNPSTILAALKAKKESARTSINAVNTASIQYANATNKRETAFVPFNSTITRGLNSLRASPSDDNTDAAVATIARKILNTRAPKGSTSKEAPAPAAGPAVKVKKVSTSQRSYDSQVDNFDRFVEALANIPEYKPNEPELKVEALKAYAAELRKVNDECNTTSYALDAARANRNAELYTTSTGLVDVALSAKAYVKSLFGATSAEFKRISSLEFRTVK
ncbi:hypothetical protein [uncultured Acetobacteroides sp.]|uniref:hypothetical protein n=1 Tax=uncultured Acetobacteroides sp. TaxID=1760811 RepID=UPI0029F4DE83|nr:hypothetical protein [uncultured Acetobacteroides sp.]